MNPSAQDLLDIDEPADHYPEHLEELKRQTAEALKANDFDTLVVHAGNEISNPGRDDAVNPAPHPELARWIRGLYTKDAPPVENGKARLDRTLGHAIVFSPKEKPKLYVQSNPANKWSIQAGIPEGAEEHFDVTVDADQEELWRKLRKALPKRSAFLGPENMPNVSRERKERYTRNLMYAPESLTDHLHWNRLAKTPYELACIVLATRRAAAGHQAAREVFENSVPGQADVSEGSVLSTYLHAAQITHINPPYDPVVAFGPNGIILHYPDPGYQITSGSTLLIDAGAEHNGYASDITCTHTREGASDEFKEILARLDQTQRELAAIVQPGNEYDEIQKQMYLKIAQILIDTGVIIGGIEADEAARLGIIVHGFGHPVGAHVHDSGVFQANHTGQIPELDPTLKHFGYKYARGPIGEHHITSIEPGMYFHDGLQKQFAAASLVNKIDWRLVRKLAQDGGMRLETNVIALPDGPWDVTRHFLPEITNAAGFAV